MKDSLSGGGWGKLSGIFSLETHLTGMCSLSLQAETHLLKASSDDSDPVLNGSDAIRVAHCQDGFSHCYRCVNIHSLFFHFLHELLKQKRFENLRIYSSSTVSLHCEGEKISMHFPLLCVLTQASTSLHLGVSGTFFPALKDMKR